MIHLKNFESVRARRNFPSVSAVLQSAASSPTHRGSEPHGYKREHRIFADIGTSPTPIKGVFLGQNRQVVLDMMFGQPRVERAS